MTYTNTLRQLKEVYVRLEKKEEAEMVQGRIDSAYAAERQEEAREDSVGILTAKLYQAYNQADYQKVVEIYEKFNSYDAAQANSVPLANFVSNAYIQLGQKEKGEAISNHKYSSCV